MRLQLYRYYQSAEDVSPNCGMKIAMSTYILKLTQQFVFLKGQDFQFKYHTHIYDQPNPLNYIFFCEFISEFFLWNIILMLLRSADVLIVGYRRDINGAQLMSFFFNNKIALRKNIRNIQPII